MTNAVDSQEKATSFSFFNAKYVSYLILILAIGVSSYLSYLKYASADAICIAGGAFDCGTVLNSVYSEFFGIPIAWLGLATNIIILTLLALQDRVAILQEFGTLLVFGVVLFAFIYSVYLVYLQAFIIKAYCPWCLSHEALITILFIIWSIQAFKELSAE